MHIRDWLDLATNTSANAIINSSTSTPAKSTTTKKFSSTSASCSRLDAELILLHVLRQSDRSWLTLHEDTELSPSDLQTANRLVKKRLAGTPLAYVLGYKEFYGRSFTVTPATLIPRPETEDLIDISLNLWYNRETELDISPPVTPLLDAKTVQIIKKTPQINTIIDVGTGSGCIAITLALELQNLPQTTGPNTNHYITKHDSNYPTPPQIFALDNSATALKVARQNARALGAESVTFLKSDLLQNFCEKELSSTLIIANLPYVDMTWDWLSPELAHEPPQALYAEDHGLAIIKRLIREVSQLSQPTTTPTQPHQQSHSARSHQPPYSPHPTYLLLEADPCQHSAIITYAEQHHLRHLLTHHFALLFLLTQNNI